MIFRGEPHQTGKCRRPQVKIPKGKAGQGIPIRIYTVPVCTHVTYILSSGETVCDGLSGLRGFGAQARCADPPLGLAVYMHDVRFFSVV